MSDMRAAGFDAEPAAAQGKQAECKIDTPVKLHALHIAGGASRSITFPDGPVVACRFAVRFGQWATDLADPLVQGRLGSDLAAIRTGPGFECRTRDSIPGAKMSAHASGLAVDIAGFELADGRKLAVTDKADAAEIHLLQALRTSACGWFTTILGPGSDPYHTTHWHFDIMQHGSSINYRICE